MVDSVAEIVEKKRMARTDLHTSIVYPALYLAREIIGKPFFQFPGGWLRQNLLGWDSGEQFGAHIPEDRFVVNCLFYYIVNTLPLELHQRLSAPDSFPVQ